MVGLPSFGSGKDRESVALDRLVALLYSLNHQTPLPSGAVACTNHQLNLHRFGPDLVFSCTITILAHPELPSLRAQILTIHVLKSRASTDQAALLQHQSGLTSNVYIIIMS